jgi:hypothetical protein
VLCFAQQEGKRRGKHTWWVLVTGKGPGEEHLGESRRRSPNRRSRERKTERRETRERGTGKRIEVGRDLVMVRVQFGMAGLWFAANGLAPENGLVQFGHFVSRRDGLSGCSRSKC